MRVHRNVADYLYEYFAQKGWGPSINGVSPFFLIL